MEPSRSTLYRTFLLVSLSLLLLLAVLLRIAAFAMLAAAFAVVLIVAWLDSRRRLKALEARRELFPSAFEGDTITVTLDIENIGGRDAMFIELADRFGPALSDEQIITEPGPIPPDSIRRLEYLGYCSRHWGLYMVGPIGLAVADPAGLFHAARPVPEVAAFAVFPRVYEVAGLARLGARASLTPQDATAGRSGQSLTYLGVRDYRSGDDPRRIHWPATARRGALTVKEYETDLVPYFTLFLDLQREHRAGTGRKSTLEYVVRTGASLLWTAARGGNFVQLFADGGKPLALPPGRGEAHLTFALHELIQVRQEGTVPLADVAARSLTALPVGSTAAFLFGTATPELGRIRELLERLRARGVRPAFVFVNHHSFAPVDRWPMPRDEVVERRQELTYFLRSRGIPFAFLDATDELEDELSRPDFLT